MRYRELFEEANTVEDLLALVNRGFDASPLYHGSKAEFSVFDPNMARTAKHIYTSPDVNTASAYGDNVYECIAIQKPQANLIDDYKLIAELAETFVDYFIDSVEMDRDLFALAQSIKDELQAADPELEYEDARDAALEDPRYKALEHKKAVEFAADLITSSRIYDFDYRGRVQDEIMDECFGRGYKSVRFYDHSSHGESISVVFADPKNLVILKKVR